MKKVLFPFRFNNLKDIFNDPKNNPKEFLYGMYELKEKNVYDIDFVFESRSNKKGIRRKLLWLLEQPFVRAIKLGMPFGIYWFHKNKYKGVDTIVCINDAISFSILFWKKFGFIDSKVITLFQSLPERYNKYFKHRRCFIWIIKKILSQADTILVLSSSAKYELAKVFNISLDKIEVFYFGADLDFWKYKKYEISKRNYILAIGNDMNRDYETLCRVVSNKYKTVIVSNKKIEYEGIEFKSNLTNEEVRELYYGARIVITPSIKLLTESSGLSTTVQAMASGTPVLISDSLPMRELFVENKEIFYFEPENKSSLEEKLNDIWNNEALLKDVSNNAYKSIKIKYNTFNMAKELKSLIK